MSVRANAAGTSWSPALLLGQARREALSPEADDRLLELAAAALLREGKDTPRARRLVASLMARGLLGAACRRMARTDAGAAASLFLLATRIHSGALQSLDAPPPDSAPLSTDQLAPLVEAVILLSEIAHPAAGSALDARLRSMLALASGRLGPLARLGESCFADADPRVRANAVEGLWGRDDGEALDRYRAALQDPHPRPAANACVGLYLAGSTQSVRELRAMSLHPSPNFRAAAAWAMGRTGDERFLPVLAEMRAANPVPVALLKCIVQARDRIFAVQRLPRAGLSLRVTAVRRSSHLEVEVQVASGDEAPVLKPSHWAMEADGAPLWEYDAALMAATSASQTWKLTALAVGGDAVRRLGLSVSTGTHWGRCEWIAGETAGEGDGPLPEA